MAEIFINPKMSDKRKVLQGVVMIPKEDLLHVCNPDWQWSQSLEVFYPQASTASNFWVCFASAHDKNQLVPKFY